jgi:radical SAM protein with 4Fe4S-binding SPASM domain
MGKTKRFHQYVIIDKGPANTAVIDCLKGDVYHVENRFIEAFENKHYDEIAEFIAALEAEKLIIEVEETKWMPQVKYRRADAGDEFPLRMEVEEGADIELIRKKFQGFQVSRIDYYGQNPPTEIFPQVPMEIKEKDFHACSREAEVTSNREFRRIEENRYGFNRQFNSCWGNRVAITRDNEVKPCIHSDIVICKLDEEAIPGLLEKAGKYWRITKDQVEKCRNCELRYICFDCRVKAVRGGNGLYGTNPTCKYDPVSGTWGQ